MVAKKDLYELGEIPPLGHVPKKMYASVLRQSRYGNPESAYEVEVMDVPELGPKQVMVHVMAAGVNYNGVWTSLAKPVDMIAARQKYGDPHDFHIGGSEGSGVVWAVGPEVKGVKVGDHVMVSPVHWDESANDIRMGLDPIASTSARVWGFEDNFGCFAQFSVVDDYQCFQKPENLTFEQASCVFVSFATAYRQLTGWAPHVVRPGDPILIWGGAGGLGTAAIQITRELGGKAIAVVSSEEKAEFCMSLGAHGTLNRKDFDHWGRLPVVGSSEFDTWQNGVRKFGKAFWEVLGEKRNPWIVFEHSGQDTMPTSIFVCDNGGMVVTCGATSGYNLDIDARVLWMRLKRLQGSHFASLRQCQEVVNLLGQKRLDPLLARTWDFDEIGAGHQVMHDNAHPPGNMSAIINAPERNMTHLPL